ncbi:MAG TPA: ATP-binding protein [Acidimicrobiales bacterium]|nr:ATP-binding protein [Acidimicrobiales bacterium]
MKRTVVGTLAALAAMAALTAIMLPIRSHLSIATTALILVIPVVIGVVAGGFLAGILSVVAGFVVYDFFFIPPYLTLWVGARQNWAALGVYAAVMFPVSQVVAGMNSAKAEARRQGREIRELFGLSHLLVEDKPLDVLLSVIVTTVSEVFDAQQVALLLPGAGGLEVVASAGEPLTEAQVHRVLPAAGELATLAPRPVERDGLLVVALAAAARPVGLLVLSADAAARHEREPLLLFANHIALAVERIQLRDQALQARLAEEVAQLAKTLVGAVSHDLRTPLTRIKASSSTLADSELDIDPAQTRRLAALIDAQADRLADLVQNLLDMSRIQAGVLQPRYTVAPLADLVTTVVNDLAPGRRGHHIRVDVPDDLPPIDADLVLVSRVLTNLLENALRYSPKDAPIAVRANLDTPDRIEVSITDHGPGVNPHRRNDIFELFTRRDADAGAGLGLTIAKTFVEAHGQRIWVDEAPHGGAVFHFTLPVAAPIPEEPKIAARAHR